MFLKSVYPISLQLRDISHELELTETVMAMIDLGISRKKQFLTHKESMHARDRNHEPLYNVQQRVLRQH